MSQLEHLHLNDRQKRSIFLFGSQTWNRERILKESFDAGLRVVLAKVASDTSGELPARVLRDSDGGFDTETLAHTTEILPDQLSAISTEMLDRLRQHYGVDWCALPLNGGRPIGRGVPSGRRVVPAGGSSNVGSHAGFVPGFVQPYRSTRGRGRRPCWRPLDWRENAIRSHFDQRQCRPTRRQ